VSNSLLERVIDTPMPRSDKLILMALARHGHRDGTECRPSIATLAAKSSLDERNVRRGLARLAAAGWIVETAPPRQHRPAVYRIVVERLLARPGASAHPGASPDRAPAPALTPDRAPAPTLTRPDRAFVLARPGEIDSPDRAPAPTESTTESEATTKTKTESKTTTTTASPTEITWTHDGHGDFTGITAAHRARWAMLGPHVDVDLEICGAAEWWRNNPMKRRNNVANFLARWITRAEEQAATKPMRAGRDKYGIAPGPGGFFDRGKARAYAPRHGAVA
jgi:Helix-turn-helix domain